VAPAVVSPVGLPEVKNTGDKIAGATPIQPP
jgi:hypothetical protein